MNSRYIKIDGWIFEIKAVKAMKVDNYGEPYSAVANFTLQHDNAYIDGLMTKKHDDFSREDHQAFEQFFTQLGIKQVSFDRFSSRGFKTVTRDTIHAKADLPKLKLVQ